MKTLKITISGAVQGIFFRKFMEEKANELGLKGFVRNLQDSRVEIVIEGKDENINKMLEHCKKGSPHSKVDEAEIEEIRHQGFDDFKMIRF